MRILVTNDDGWDAPGLAVLKSLAAEWGEIFVLAPLDPHSCTGHRVTEDSDLLLAETAPREFTLAGTPADCVRVALTSVFENIDWVLSGVNRGGNLGSDLFTSGTVAAAREAALLGKPAIAISQYIQRGLPLEWERTRELARHVIADLLHKDCWPRSYWNVNLPHLPDGHSAAAVLCDPDNLPPDVRFHRAGNALRFAGSYQSRPRTPGRDIDLCFQGAITVSRLQL